MCRHAEHSGEYKHGNACVQPHPCTSRTGLKTHEGSHTVHTYCTCGHTNRLAKRTHSRWHWGVTVKCKPSDYSLRRWEERGGDRSGGVLKRGQRRRRRDEKKKKKARAINMHKAWLLSFWDTADCCCYFTDQHVLLVIVFLTLLICSSIFNFGFTRGYVHTEDISVNRIQSSETHLIRYLSMIRVDLSWFKAPCRITSLQFPH